MVFTCYLGAYKPFIEKKSNHVEIFNEFCSILTIYMYMAFKQSLSPVHLFGTLYITTYVINISINFIIILQDAVKTLPDAYQKLKDKINDFKYDKFKTKWFQSKKEIAKKFPDDRFQ